MINRDKYKITLLLLLLWSFTVAITSTNNSQWTVQTLKEYVDQRFAAIQMAVDKADEATEKRFESVNEFRAQLSDQSRTFIPRQEYEIAHENLKAQVVTLYNEMEKTKNVKQGGNIVWAYVLSGVSLIGTIVMLVMNIIKIRGNDSH